MTALEGILSGINTGDETASTIKTKLGITTLSGSNTGDQIISDETITISDNTTNNASPSKHGFLPKLDNTGTKYLRDDGTWQTVSSGSSNIQTTATAGETLTAPCYVRAGNINTIITNTTSNGFTTLGYSITGGYERGQSFSWTTNIFGVIKVWLYKVGNPGTVINCELFSDYTFTTLVATSDNSITSSNLTTNTSGEECSFIFSSLGTLSTGAYYFKLNIVSGSVSTTNYVGVLYSSTSSYSSGILYYIYQDGSVSGETSDLKFIISTYEDTTKVYKALATSTSYNKVIGAVGTTINSGTSGNIILAGEVSGYSSLTPGETYYLKDDGTIGTTAGTTSVKLGKALPGGTKLNFLIQP